MNKLIVFFAMTLFVQATTFAMDKTKTFEKLWAQKAAMLKDMPTAQQLAEKYQKYTCEQLKQAEKDTEAVRDHQNYRAGDLCRDAATDPWARAAYHDANQREQAAREQLEVIREVIAAKCAEKTIIKKDEGKSQEKSIK